MQDVKRWAVHVVVWMWRQNIYSYTESSITLQMLKRKYHCRRYLLIYGSIILQ